MGYELLGGLVEEREEPARAAAREAEEESGWRPIGEPEHLIGFKPLPGQVTAPTDVYLWRQAVRRWGSRPIRRKSAGSNGYRSAGFWSWLNGASYWGGRAGSLAVLCRLPNCGRCSAVRRGWVVRASPTPSVRSAWTPRPAVAGWLIRGPPGPHSLRSAWPTRSGERWTSAGVGHDLLVTVGVSRGGNAQQGDFGESWLQAVAASCGLLHGRPATLDFEKADVQLTYRGVIEDTYNPTVKVQVKTAIGLRVTDDDFVAYDLDVHTYDVLRRRDHSVRRVLVVIALPADGARIQLTDDGTLLLGRGAWLSLEGAPPTDNTSTIVVRLPLSNTLDEDGLYKMLKTCGVRSSTPVPDFDVWEEA